MNRLQILQLALLAPLLVEMLILARRAWAERFYGVPGAVMLAARPQLWLQDLLLIVFCHGGYVLSRGEDAQEPIHLYYACLTTATATLTAVELAGSARALRRAVVFALCMTAYMLDPRFALLAFWAWTWVGSNFGRQRGPAPDASTRRAVWVAVALYAIAFVLPMELARRSGLGDIEKGWDAYLVCAPRPSLDERYEPAFFLWLANPAFWIAIGHLRRRNGAFAAFWAGLGFAFGIGYYAFDDPPFKLVVMPAYHLWLFSMLVACAFGLRRWRRPLATAGGVAEQDDAASK